MGACSSCHFLFNFQINSSVRWRHGVCISHNSVRLINHFLHFLISLGYPLNEFPGKFHCNVFYYVHQLSPVFRSLFWKLQWNFRRFLTTKNFHLLLDETLQFCFWFFFYIVAHKNEKKFDDNSVKIFQYS